jgi:hypothetical protein
MQPDDITIICNAIRSGVDYLTAAIAKGYTYDQAVKELSDEKLKAEIQKAEALFEVLQIHKINAEGGFKGAMWLLQKKMPEKYGDRIPVQQAQVRQIEAKQAEIVDYNDDPELH